MRKMIMQLFFCFLFTGVYQNLAAQESKLIQDQTAAYIKDNLAFGRFGVLGVDAKSYARVLEAHNFKEPGKRLTYLTIDGVDFADDGLLFDKTAGDGILTSTRLFAYSDRVPFLQEGTERIQEDIALHDIQFKYTGSAEIAAKWPKIKVSLDCDAHFCNCKKGECWCGSCVLGGWPHGCVWFDKCHIDVTLEW